MTLSEGIQEENTYSEKMHHPREENIAMPRLFGFWFLKKSEYSETE